MANINSIEQKLKTKNLTLPKAASPLANYVPVRQTGNQLFISGQVSEDENGFITGCVGSSIDVDQAAYGAQRCALSLLSQIQNNAGVSLEKVRFIKLMVFVNSAPDFYDHAKVANGASDLLAELLGENGRHARSAFGVAALPFNVAVEVEAIVELL